MYSTRMLSLSGDRWLSVARVDSISNHHCRQDIDWLLIVLPPRTAACKDASRRSRPLEHPRATVRGQSQILSSTVVPRGANLLLVQRKSEIITPLHSHDREQSSCRDLKLPSPIMAAEIPHDKHRLRRSIRLRVREMSRMLHNAWIRYRRRLSTLMTGFCRSSPSDHTGMAVSSPKAYIGSKYERNI
ncbi:hypothetical protein TIFTF001_009820 [Ficus carica]|uniref:Uncharacterized protein n=1 Tax=Ficus carica TaxID=3494 RepID=A0AA87ZNU0_FICCA|nr:hypothetical protein TIFTF001_009820 [Ficus carica]